MASTTNEIWVGDNDERKLLTGEELDRYLAEVAEYERLQVAKAQKIAAEAEAKANAEAKLAALGLTAEEISALSK